MESNLCCVIQGRFLVLVLWRSCVKLLHCCYTLLTYKLCKLKTFEFVKLFLWLFSEINSKWKRTHFLCVDLISQIDSVNLSLSQRPFSFRVLLLSPLFILSLREREWEAESGFFHPLWKRSLSVGNLTNQSLSRHRVSKCKGSLQQALTFFVHLNDKIFREICRRGIF